MAIRNINLVLSSTILSSWITHRTFQHSVNGVVDLCAKSMRITSAKHVDNVTPAVTAGGVTDGSRLRCVYPIHR